MYIPVHLAHQGLHLNRALPMENMINITNKVTVDEGIIFLSPIDLQYILNWYDQLELKS